LVREKCEECDGGGTCSVCNDDGNEENCEDCNYTGECSDCNGDGYIEID